MKIRTTLTWILLWQLAACTAADDDDRESFSILIVDGTVYDGSLAAPRRTNVGIIDDRIASVDAAADAPAEIVIDAAGMAVMPGFIDPHTHAGDDLLNDETKVNINFLTQGVTTVFVGNDGSGLPDRAGSVQTMQSQGVGTNVAFFGGHGAARTAARGLEARAPTAAELD